MNVRKIKGMFWLAGIVLFSASIWVCAVGLRQPTILSGDIGNNSQIQANSNSTGQEVVEVSLSAYEKVWGKQLRAMQVKPVVARKTPESKPSPAAAPNIKLVGTMVENGNSFAIIEAKRGEHTLLGVGDSINQEIQVLSVESGFVEVMYRGQKFTLESPKEEDGK